MTDPQVRKYAMSEAFQKDVALLLATDRVFYARIGEDLDPEAFSDVRVEWVVRACQSIADSIGRGPQTVEHVVQRLTRICKEDGKITLDLVLDCADMLTEKRPEDVDHEASVAELSAIVRRYNVLDGINDLSRVYISARPETRDDDMEAAIEKLARMNRIGKTQTSIGVRFGPEVAGDIRALRLVDRLPTGIVELDALTGGGLPRGKLGVWLGRDGAGKSQALNMQAAYACMSGMTVAVATLELPTEYQQSRFWSALTNVPEEDISSGAGIELATKRLQSLEGLGVCYHADFDPGSTQDEVIAWVDEIEQRESVDVDLVVIDYADKLHGSKDDQYRQMLKVYDGLLTYAKKTKKYVWTATQAKNVKGVKILDSVHAADSSHKQRSCDMMISINPDHEFKNVRLFVCKSRVGPSRGLTEEIPTDYAFGRLCHGVMPGKAPKPRQGIKERIDKEEFDDLFGPKKEVLH